jgi:hypothetical protein
VVVAGFVLVLVGLALVMPRGPSSGPAIRNIEIGTGYIQQTPGYQEAPTGRSRWIRFGLGFVCLGVGVLLLVLGI